MLHYEMVVISGMTNITSDLDPEIWSPDLVVEISRPQMETLDPVMVMMSSMVLILGIPEMVHGESLVLDAYNTIRSHGVHLYYGLVHRDTRDLGTTVPEGGDLRDPCSRR